MLHREYLRNLLRLPNMECCTYCHCRSGCLWNRAPNIRRYPKSTKMADDAMEFGSWSWNRHDSPKGRRFQIKLSEFWVNNVSDIGNELLYKSEKLIWHEYWLHRIPRCCAPLRECQSFVTEDQESEVILLFLYQPIHVITFYATFTEYDNRILFEISCTPSSFAQVADS